MALDTTSDVAASPWRWRPRIRSFASLRRAPIIPLAIIAVLVICGIFGEWIAPHDATRPDPLLRLTPPAWQEGGSWSYPLGTDPVGRDILSQIIVGARVTLIIGFTVVAISGGIGLVVALVSGYFQGWADMVLMRLTDAVISMPFLVIAIAVAGIVGQSLTNLILILGLLSWAVYARVLRGEVLRVKQADFVTWARISGTPSWRILFKHVFPNIANTLIVLATLQLGVTVIAAASLDFLGLGVPPPTPAWGSMLSDGRPYMTTAWWVITMPGIAIALTVMATNLLGDWMRIRLDPKQQAV